MAAQIKTYHRLIIATGTVEELPFDLTNITFARNQGWATFDPIGELLVGGLPELTALRLVNHWNYLAVNAGSKRYLYWI